MKIIRWSNLKGPASRLWAKVRRAHRSPSDDALKQAHGEYLAIKGLAPPSLRGRFALRHARTALAIGVLGIGGGFVILMAALFVPHYFGLEGAARGVVRLLFVGLGFGCVPLSLWRLKVATTRNYERAIRDVERAETLEPQGVSGQSGVVIPNAMRR